ncbi:MAG: metal ABC transporter substrate-binding protein [Chloroflexota bacterium]
MKKASLFLVTLLVLSLVVGSVLSGCAPAATSRVKVVTTTSLLTYVAEQVGGDKVEVVNVIPPTQHPGDFDAKPGDIQKLAEASLFLWHNFPGEVFVPGLISSANHTGLTVAAIDIKGNWMTPQVQREAADKIAAALSQADSQNSAAYQQAAAAYKGRVTAKETELKAKLAPANLTNINVIGSFWQAGFIGWAGMKVVATYVDPVSLTPAVSKDLVDKGKAAKVTLVIDNLQNGQNAGKSIAEELGAKRIILSNFPGGFANTETWEKAIDRNIELILGAVSR